MIELQEWDTAIFYGINSGLSSSLFDLIMPVMSGPWPWWVLGGTLMVHCLKKRTKREWMFALTLLLCIGITDFATSYSVKPFFSRLRPCYMLNSVRLVVESCGGKLGLPSNHSANAMALAVFTLYFRGKWIGVVIILFALLIGFSRIYVGVHFPGDVILGFFTGASVACFYSTLIVSRFKL